MRPNKARAVGKLTRSTLCFSSYSRLGIINNIKTPFVFWMIVGSHRHPRFGSSIGDLAFIRKHISNIAGLIERGDKTRVIVGWRPVNS
jgi:hypothetical protein